MNRCLLPCLRDQFEVVDLGRGWLYGMRSEVVLALDLLERLKPVFYVYHVYEYPANKAVTLCLPSLPS